MKTAWLSKRWYYIFASELQECAALFYFQTNKHAPINKITVKTVKSHWIDEELKNCMVERDEAKCMPIKSGSPTDWQTYCK